MRHRGPVRRTRRGDFTISISAQERNILRDLPAQLRELLTTTDDPSLRRVFPPAYIDDDEHQEEYRRLMASDLLERHTEAIDVMESSIDAERLDESQLNAWLGALNNLRLVLGTRLDVTEDMDTVPTDPADPATAAFALYHYLTWLQTEIIEALTN